MKIVREKNSDLVVYFFNDWEAVEITETAMRGDITAFDIKADTHEVLTDVQPPTYHQLGGALTYKNGIWAVSNVALYDAHAAAEVVVYSTQIRLKRKTLLTASDWTQVLDAPVDQAAWATYRQALRDIPQQAGFPLSIVWPSQPE